MKIFKVLLLLSGFLTTSVFADAGCQGEFGTQDEGLRLSLVRKDGWRMEVRNQKGKLLYRAQFRPAEVSVGFCHQSFQNEAGFHGRSSYCKTLFRLELNAPDGRVMDFSCSGTFDRIN